MVGLERFRGAACALAAALVAVFLFLPTQRAPFVCDDLDCVVYNPEVASLANAARVWVSAYPPNRSIGGLYRPVTATTFLLDHALAGMDAASFHRTNVALHAAACAALTWLLLRLRTPCLAALIAGLLFAVHPVHTEAVSWVVGRAEVLAGLFSFLAILAWVRFRERGRTLDLALSALAYFLALGSKESAALLPLVLFAGERLGLIAAGAPSARPVRDRERWRSGLIPWFALALMLAAYVALRAQALEAFTPTSVSLAFAGDPPMTRAATAIAGIGKYVELCLLPLGLRLLYHDEFKVGTLLDARVALGAVVILGLCVCAWIARRRAGAVTFWILWFTAFLLIVSNVVFEIGAVLAERFLYVPSAAACALAGMLAARGLQRGGPGARAVAASLALGALALFSLQTLARNRDWCDEERFWRTELAHSPRSEKLELSLADFLLERGRAQHDALSMQEGEAHLRAGLALGRRETTSRDRVRLLIALAHRLRESGRAAEAIPLYEEASRGLRRDSNLAPDRLADVLVFWGLALESAGRPADAIPAYEEAARADPAGAGPLCNIGNILAERGDGQGAIARYREALRRDPRSGIAWVNLALALADLDRDEEACAAFASARPLLDPPTFARALDTARERYRRAALLDPRDERARMALARLESTARSAAPTR